MTKEQKKAHRLQGSRQHYPDFDIYPLSHYMSWIVIKEKAEEIKLYNSKF